MVAHTPQAPLGLTTGRRFRLAAREIVGTALIMVAYFYLRGIRPDNADSSVSRSLRLIQFEQSIGVFQEVRWQAAFLGHGWLMNIANLVYAWGHYPVMLAIALWLVFKDPVRFRFVRNVLLVSATIGVISYWLIPAAPPRLMEHYGYDFGFIDTVHGATSNVSYFQPGPFVNDYAALPSFHFGWILLSTMAIWSNTSNRYVRGFAVAMSVVMWWAVTVTGNHYFFDMVMGGVVVVLSWLFVRAMGDVHLRELPRRSLQQIRSFRGGASPGGAGSPGAPANAISAQSTRRFVPIFIELRSGVPYVRYGPGKSGLELQGATTMRVQESRRPGSGPVTKIASTQAASASRQPDGLRQPEASKVEDPFDYIT